MIEAKPRELTLATPLLRLNSVESLLGVLCPLATVPADRRSNRIILPTGLLMEFLPENLVRNLSRSILSVKVSFTQEAEVGGSDGSKGALAATYIPFWGCTK